ncbi:MAG: hypothetical protein H6585_02555 [Flavobacteriales bacterium]|nr:hypothetical protein [Flavobacteriales bacterium]MCB9447210.1 hypothetical protein [Flavobacteriales bacterium]
MNAIIPINIAALRVSENDNTNVVVDFKGRVANFNSIPFQSTDMRASTGDTVVQPLDSKSSPLNPLGTGIHVHWELPDYFRRGVQPIGGADVIFPQVPNRWLVIRYLSMYDATSQSWQDATSHAWVVESDYISPALIADADGALRPAVPVPLSVQNNGQQQPFAYMGRVVDADTWDPAGEDTSHYLPAFNGDDGKSLYLTSIGFLGPGFSSYYPDCCSVFGFWDRFTDEPELFQAITTNQPVQFKASYQVVGWINTNANDPLDGLDGKVKEEYDNYVAQCKQAGTPVKETPATVFANLMQQNNHWLFRTEDITYTLNTDDTLQSVDLPLKTICNGVLQEVVWNMLNSPSTSYFLNNPDNQTSPGVWTDTVELAVGNTPSEALSALLKKDMGNTDDDPDLLKNYEYLLDALQLGLLNNLENETNKIILLEESLHSNGFAKVQGGLLWIVQPKQEDPDQPHDADQEITLPLALAEQLHVLNQAQKNYDTARDALKTQRKQLFMDWFRYVNMEAGGITDPNVSINQLINFLTNSGGSELTTVVAAGDSAGVLYYEQSEDSGEIIGLKQPDIETSLAFDVWNKFNDFQQAMSQYPQWQVIGVPAPSFWSPTEPTVLMQGNRIEPVRRNGSAKDIVVRLTGELLTQLQVVSAGSTFTLNISSIQGQPAFPKAPYQADLTDLIGEGYITIPSLASITAAALKAEGGNGNPADANLPGVITSLQLAEGGLSPLEGKPDTGLYALIRQSDYVAKANEQISIQQPLALTFTFTNEAGNGWAPDAVAWNAQQQYPEFDNDRYDPFLPVSMVWKLAYDPLKQSDGSGYSATNLTDFFEMDPDAIDYVYRMNGTTPVDFTVGQQLPYDNSVVLSKRPTFNLTTQIDNYAQNYPTDPADPTLSQISDYYKSLHIMSQAMSGFTAEQILRTYIARIKVEDLTRGPRDAVTTQINAAATASDEDDWYDYSFNADAPVSAGLLAIHNFGPMRAGFMEIQSLEIVDVFGQRMDLQTAAQNPDGSLQVTPAMTLAPLTADTEHANTIYLPPRINWPTRLWYRWLSAAHDTSVPGFDNDFVEMNTHPATSPVFGWIIPNHLDNTLFFYDAPGTPIGSFGIEHDTLIYRTRAGNLANPSSDLSLDIGPKGSPTVNPHLATFMWYVDGQDANFLADFMNAIQQSDRFIDPTNSAQDASLAVLLGRPLALTRAVLGLETQGGLLPISQASTEATDPWPQDINNNRYTYTDRIPYSSANMGNVQFPVRMGDLANLDDGLVAYLIEATGEDPYSTVYAPAAPAGGQHHVTAPDADTLQLVLNGASITLTMLVDPRAAVHATTGVLPVQELGIPPDQYSEILRNLQITFATTPVLNERQQLVVPLPQESGYVWSWVNPGAEGEVPLKPNESNDDAVWDFTPQTLREGWLKLSQNPNQDQIS